MEYNYKIFVYGDIHTFFCLSKYSAMCFRYNFLKYKIQLNENDIVISQWLSKRNVLPTDSSNQILNKAKWFDG